MNVVPQREPTWLNTHRTITTRVFASMANGRFGSSLLEAVSLPLPPLTRLQIYCLFIAVHSLSHIQLFVTPWTAARQASLSFTTPGFSILHHLPELAQIHVCWVRDAIQPSHPLLPSSPPAFNLSQHQCLFQWAGYSQEVAKVLELQHHSFQ